MFILTSCNGGRDITLPRNGVHPPTADSKATATRVIEYRPAPGQFIGEAMLGFTGNETTPEAAIEYAQNRLTTKDIISLGGFGGYVIVAFDHSVEAWGKPTGDFTIVGNQFSDSSEPGIVWVMSDTNGNNEPDEDWYELKGEYYSTQTKNYAVTYYRTEPVAWSDSEGNTGTIERIAFHGQASYYPAWITEDEYSLTGMLLKDRSFTEESGKFNTGNYGWGYADNYGSDTKNGRTKLFIGNAVRADGSPANLKAIDFVKIQTAVNVQGGAGVGELSTEISEIRDENL